MEQTSRSAAHHRRTAHEKRMAEFKAESKRVRDYEWEHFLYRCYDAGGTLLYIGCTTDVESRMQVHASSWSNPASAYLNIHMDRYEADPEPHVGRIAGRVAERAAIAEEAPLLNVHHNQGRGLPRVPMKPAAAEELHQAGDALTAFLERNGATDVKPRAG